jgi:predicted nucleic acid-binding protein
MIIVDASAVVEFLFATPAGVAVGDRIADAAEEVAAPCLLDVEVAQVVRRWTLAGLISSARGAKAMEHLADLNALRWPHEPLLPRIWTLRHNASAYDAAYVALAESLGGILLTCDRSTAEIPGIHCPVELVG